MRVVELLLTEEEKLAIGAEVIFLPENSTLSVADARGRIIDRVAQAALAKALWGVVAWLKDYERDHYTTDGLFRSLQDSIEQAGITQGVSDET